MGTCAQSTPTIVEVYEAPASRVVTLPSSVEIVAAPAVQSSVSRVVTLPTTSRVTPPHEAGRYPFSNPNSGPATPTLAVRAADRASADRASAGPKNLAVGDASSKGPAPTRSEFVIMLPLEEHYGVSARVLRANGPRRLSRAVSAAAPGDGVPVRRFVMHRHGSSVHWFI